MPILPWFFAKTRLYIQKFDTSCLCNMRCFSTSKLARLGSQRTMVHAANFLLLKKHWKKTPRGSNLMKLSDYVTLIDVNFRYTPLMQVVLEHKCWLLRNFWGTIVYVYIYCWSKCCMVLWPFNCSKPWYDDHVIIKGERRTA